MSCECVLGDFDSNTCNNAGINWNGCGFPMMMDKNECSQITTKADCNKKDYNWIGGVCNNACKWNEPPAPPAPPTPPSAHPLHCPELINKGLNCLCDYKTQCKQNPESNIICAPMHGFSVQDAVCQLSNDTMYLANIMIYNL